MGADATPPADGPANRKGRIVPNGTAKVFNFIPWVLGILACLIVAGVVASVSTAGSVGRIDENLSLFRAESRREFDRQEREIGSIEEKLDAHILRTDNTFRSGNGGGT